MKTRFVWEAYCDNNCLSGHKISKTMPSLKPSGCPFCGLDRRWVAQMHHPDDCEECARTEPSQNKASH